MGENSATVLRRNKPGTKAEVVSSFLFNIEIISYLTTSLSLTRGHFNVCLVGNIVKFQSFFNCYWDVPQPQPNFGHCGVDSRVNLMLITVFLIQC